MTTQASILANRLNAQKSTGPKTPQGKAVVAQNALKHGLSARHDVITTESQPDFDLHRDSLLAELDPQGPMESILTDRIVSLSWRLKRADLIQNQTIDAMNEKKPTNPLANLAKSFGLKSLGTPQPEPSEPQADLTLGRIALKDFANARVLDRLLMYERRIEHSLYKTTLELQRLHLIRNLTPTTDQLEPKDPRLASGPVPEVTKDRNNTPAPPISPPNQTPMPLYPRACEALAQNKPNPQNPKTNATSYTTKRYTNIPLPSTRKNKPKTNPIPRPQDACPEGDIRDTNQNQNQTNSQPRPRRANFCTINCARRL